MMNTRAIVNKAKMKKILLLILISFLSLTLNAQDILSRSQIFHAVEWRHPAFAGIQTKLSADLMYRQALNSYGNGSAYYQVGLFYPIKKSLVAGTDNSFQLSNSEIADEYYSSKKARRKQGVGIQLNNIALSPLNRKEVKLFYAYHLPISKDLYLSLGSAVKFQQNNIGLTHLNVRDELNDDFYQQIINSGSGRQSNLQVDMGSALYSSNFYASFTVNSLLFAGLQKNGMMEHLEEDMSYNFLLGYKIRLNSEILILPNAEINHFSTYGTQYKGTLRIKYKELVYVGAGMQHNLKWSGLMGFNIPGNLFLNYSYDYYTGFISEFSNGVHEVSLSYLFNNKNSSTPYTW